MYDLYDVLSDSLSAHSVFYIQCQLQHYKINMGAQCLFYTSSTVLLWAISTALFKRF